MVAKDIPRPRPASKPYHSTSDDFKLKDFTVRPQETLIARMDLKELLDGIDNAGGDE
jgi:hypothetical protein